MTGNDTLEANKRVVRAFVEALNQGRLDGLSQDYIEHDLAYPGGTSTRSDVEAKMARLAEALPDLTLTIEDMVAEGDRVAVHATASATHAGAFYGAAPTGERLEWTAMLIARVEDGVVTDVRVLRDVFGILQQLGLGPEG